MAGCQDAWRSLWRRSNRNRVTEGTQHEDWNFNTTNIRDCRHSEMCGSFTIECWDLLLNSIWCHLLKQCLLEWIMFLWQGQTYKYSNEFIFVVCGFTHITLIICWCECWFILPIRMQRRTMDSTSHSTTTKHCIDWLQPTWTFLFVNTVVISVYT